MSLNMLLFLYCFYIVSIMKKFKIVDRQLLKTKLRRLVSKFLVNQEPIVCVHIATPIVREGANETKSGAKFSPFYIQG